MLSIPEQIVRVSRIMFERRLTNIAGGNISARQGDRIFITPTGAGQKLLWDLQPSDILEFPVDTDELLHDERCSKEGVSHWMIYRALPEAGAIIHGHPFHVMPFCAAHRSIPPLNAEVDIYGEITFIPDAPFYTARQGELLVERFLTQRELVRDKAAAALLARHGIFIASSGLLPALDCLERIDISAFTNLAQKWMP